jgi:hypothetical protein
MLTSPTLGSEDPGPVARTVRRTTGGEAEAAMGRERGLPTCSECSTVLSNKLCGCGRAILQGEVIFSDEEKGQSLITMEVMNM